MRTSAILKNKKNKKSGKKNKETKKINKRITFFPIPDLFAKILFFSSFLLLYYRFFVDFLDHRNRGEKNRECEKKERENYQKEGRC